MKAKKTIRVIITAVVIVGAMAAAFALGASGKFSMVNPHDRLVGVLITTQPWPDGEDRVYAEYVDGEYVFNGIDGIACFASMDDNTLCTHVDDAMTDASVDLHSVNDDAEEVTINATLYLSSSSACIVQRNPVYQTASGAVYVVAGDGAEYRGEGLSGNFSLSDSVKRYEGGKTMTYGTYLNVAVKIIAEPEKIEVSQFEADGRLISLEYYAPGALPDSSRPHHPVYDVIADTSRFPKQTPPAPQRRQRLRQPSSRRSPSHAPPSPWPRQPDVPSRQPWRR